MNMHVNVVDRTVVTMGEDGTIRIPAAMLERLGIVPGLPVEVGRNDQGELVVFQETPEERRERIGKVLESIKGKYDFGMSTDEYMAMIRGYDDDPA